MKKMHCCESMTAEVEADPAYEQQVAYDENFNEYGLRDRFDPSLRTPIRFCPWCGTRLPTTLSTPPDVPFNAGG